MKKKPSRRIPLYIPAEAAHILDRIGRIAHRRRWSRNKTIVEILRRTVARRGVPADDWS
ncbi:MAG: hypothetical protein HYX76_08265 [Acidobacteria bacterium]|nr:hypothetical protein [Acidobacteriota bacterium]